MSPRVNEKVSPAPGYLLVEPQEEEKKTAAGIILPESHEEKPQRGRVVAVGSSLVTDYGTKLEPPCRKGDLVVFKKWSGNEYKSKGKDREYLFVKFDDILAILS